MSENTEKQLERANMIMKHAKGVLEGHLSVIKKGQACHALINEYLIEYCTPKQTSLGEKVEAFQDWCVSHPSALSLNKFKEIFADELNGANAKAIEALDELLDAFSSKKGWQRTDAVSVGEVIRKLQMCKSKHTEASS